MVVLTADVFQLFIKTFSTQGLVPFFFRFRYTSTLEQFEAARQGQGRRDVLSAEKAL